MLEEGVSWSSVVNNAHLIKTTFTSGKTTKDITIALIILILWSPQVPQVLSEVVNALWHRLLPCWVAVSPGRPNLPKQNSGSGVHTHETVLSWKMWSRRTKIASQNGPRACCILQQTTSARCSKWKRTVGIWYPEESLPTQAGAAEELIDVYF